MKLRSAIKAGVAAALVGTGVYPLIRCVRAPRVHVLGYHRVVDRVVDDGPINPSLCISAASFRRQMEQVQRAFRVLTLEEALAAIDGTLELERDSISVTFDDGYRDVYTHAAPILRELGIPATVFVASGFVGTGRHFSHDRLYAALWRLGQRRGIAEQVDTLIGHLPAQVLGEVIDDLEKRSGSDENEARALDAAEVGALAETGWEIGGHTVDHVVLVREPAEVVGEQLRSSRRALEGWSGRPCRYFAYCNGYHSPGLVAALREQGYQGAVTTHDHPNQRGDDRFRVSRKVLWEGHARGLDGRWSASVSSANLHNLFGALRLTRPIDGASREVPCVA